MSHGVITLIGAIRATIRKLDTAIVRRGTANLGQNHGQAGTAGRRVNPAQTGYFMEKTAILTLLVARYLVEKGALAIRFAPCGVMDEDCVDRSDVR